MPNALKQYGDIRPTPPNKLAELAQGVSRGFWADGLGGPVDMLTTLANLGIAGGGYAGHKLGLLKQPPGLIENPVGGSEWIAQQMRQRGLLADNPGSTADTYGRVAGGLLGPLTAAKAPQVANALMQAPDAIAAAASPKYVAMGGGVTGKQGGAVGGKPKASALQVKPAVLDSTAVQSIDDYAGQHRPPMSDSGAPLHDLTGGGKIYPDDVYSHNAARYYGSGNDAEDAALFRKIHSFKGQPDAMVDIYRAVPKAAFVGGKQPPFRHGDWVTISRNYAVEHGEGALLGDYKIMRGRVPAKSLYTNGDSPYEFGLDRIAGGIE